jgi:PKD repeat protein
MKSISNKSPLIIALFVVLSQTAFSQSNKESIKRFIKDQQLKNGFVESDFNNLLITDYIKNEKSELEYYYVQQSYKDIPLYNIIQPFVVKNNNIYTATQTVYKKMLFKNANTTNPTLTKENAIINAAKSLDLPINSSDIKENKSNTTKYQYTINSISNEPVRVNLVYHVVNEKLILAWNVNIYLKDASHWWNIRVDATNGTILDKDDWVTSCNFDHEVLESNQVEENVFLNAVPPIPGTGFAQYNVFPFPIESPKHGVRSLLTDPSSIAASPYGWHDTNGTNGAEYTITRGNNVYAYDDLGNTNVPGYSPNGTATLNFNYPYNIDGTATSNKDAALTNLFYVSNAIHDILYSNGFNAAGGNFQQNNYSNGGLGNDHVLAEGFDGGGTNNANFATPPDGFNPRMQMYLWSSPAQASCSNLSILSPSAIAGTKTIAFSSWSPSTIGVTANIVLVQDGVGTSSDGCTAFTNAAAVAGKIALIDRSPSCSYTTQVENAQNAGALAVIIADSVTTTNPPTLSGTPAFTVTIPAVSITRSNGNAFKTQLGLGVVNARLIVCKSAQPDGNFDNGVVAHEYGHGVSNRLTGGPSNTSCLQNVEQGGEGWSDWLALILTIEPGDSGAMARGIGTYAKGQTIFGAGIRRFPYSTNMTINPQTYTTLASSTGPHQVGEIWCDVIWDMTWFLIRDYGFNPDVYNGTSGNNIALKLVLEGMKLQPCSPGYIDGRDAILLADDLLYNGAHRCVIWEAFARRGMGFNASQGSSNSTTDQTVDFTLPPFCFPATLPPIANFTSNSTTGTCPKEIQFTSTSTNNPYTWNWNFGDGGTSTKINPKYAYSQPGNYTVTLSVTNPLGTNTKTESNYIQISSFPTTISSTSDSVCLGDSIQLTASYSGITDISGYNVNSIPYALAPLTGTSVSLGDDAVSAALPIGFTFSFYGINYTNFYISSNGFITFSAGSTNGCCNGLSIPTAASPNAFIALGWNDLNPSINSPVINYTTSGISPNRKLVVNIRTNHYGGTTYPFKLQAVLYEGSNTIDIVTETISNAFAFDPTGVTTQGIEDANGLRGTAVPGRNATHFSAANDAYRFTPFTTINYNWTPATTVSNPTISNPYVNPTSTTNYTAVITAPNGCTSSATKEIAIKLCNISFGLNLMIQGFQDGTATMVPVLFNNGLSTDPTDVDSITVELRNSSSVSIVAYSTLALLKSDGSAAFTIPAIYAGGSYYLVLKHRNAIETWSKNPVTLTNNGVFNFKN